MLLYGASGHAKVIISCLRANLIPISGIFDDDLSKKELWKIPVVGSYRTDYKPNESLIISIGNNLIRRQIAVSIGHTFGKVLHPSAVIDASVEIGEGSVVFQNAVLQADACIGKHVIINTSSSVDHECNLADFVHIAPNATLCGNVRVGEGTLIGAGTIVAPNLRIGKSCLIAAGSVITKHIPDFAIVRGNPARVLKITSA
ncbi:acetyltransferase [Runella slithyformis]|uniref:Sugar O-acyltransferase, sialic acid O-acetyltransferase NeuD family n=1 Tax=Runella slithyformis (strain ATCC 29530 / DSM 19594 / LMG 11500 / NCIMB 11436 / LSU 4) TaxID=761193 RepID=A0A7U3ZJ94_RUNSL|nr:acetyltransferase [Runella slithyformis]AEI48145.1 sugar O-acyltransferase, sialic acid O-acetyltransferase NeuD family [Runella slithyformis DSM 19594]